MATPVAKCPKCRYELSDLPAGNCPECGRAFRPGAAELFVEPGTWVRRVSLVIWIVSSVPLVLHVGVTWLCAAIAYGQLGHWPTPMVNDPKDIPGVDLPRFAWYLFGMAAFLSFVPSFAAGVTCAVSLFKSRRRSAYMMVAGLGVAIWIAFLLQLTADPMRLNEWLAD